MCRASPQEQLEQARGGRKWEMIASVFASLSSHRQQTVCSALTLHLNVNMTILIICLNCIWWLGYEVCTSKMISVVWSAESSEGPTFVTSIFVLLHTAWQVQSSSLYFCFGAIFLEKNNISNCFSQEWKFIFSLHFTKCFPREKKQQHTRQNRGKDKSSVWLCTKKLTTENSRCRSCS